jgi:vacuolar protein sorting-associated protein VTA1
LINIWGTPDADTQAKIKYAKWNAVRIIKALKEGKDPNESNPKTEPEPEPEPEENLPTLDPSDPEVQAFQAPTNPRQPSVEDVPDEQDRVEAKLARQSSIDQSLHPSAQVSARGSPAPPFEPYPKDGFPYTAVQDDNVSPLEQSPTGRNGSVGGGYFPEVSTFADELKDVIPATAPSDDILDLGLPQQPLAPPGTKSGNDFESFPPPSIPDEPPQDYYRQSPPPSMPPPQEPAAQFHPKSPYQASPPVQGASGYSHPPPVQQTPKYTQPPPSHPSSFYQPQRQQPQYQSPPQQEPTYTPPHAFQQRNHQPGGPPPSAAAKQQLITDDMAIAKAQKHARWAISALNFEDAETAVKELREALKTLGAS